MQLALLQGVLLLTQVLLGGPNVGIELGLQVQSESLALCNYADLLRQLKKDGIGGVRTSNSSDLGRWIS